MFNSNIGLLARTKSVYGYRYTDPALLLTHPLGKEWWWVAWHIRLNKAVSIRIASSIQLQLMIPCEAKSSVGYHLWYQKCYPMKTDHSKINITSAYMRVKMALLVICFVLQGCVKRKFRRHYLPCTNLFPHNVYCNFKYCKSCHL
jgi:hypothetical protein